MTAARQDELSGPFTRATRSAMVAIDKIAGMEGEPVGERGDAIFRIQKYAITVRGKVRHKAWVEQLAEDAEREVKADTSSP